MKLAEALKLLRPTGEESGEPAEVALVCGMTPLHLGTFLAAHLRRLGPGRRFAVRTGLFGDCLGNLERSRGSGVESAAVVLEWADLDPRLGLRALGGWRPELHKDIETTVRVNLELAGAAVEAAAGDFPLAVALPTLPLPPVSHTAGWEAGAFDLRLRAEVAALGARLAAVAGVRVVNPQRLDALSPLNDRLDVKSELVSGFPYKLAHASILGEQLARLLLSSPPKKGLITDLDDTLWSGLVGEVGAQGVSWTLEHNSQMHGLYQQLLDALAGAGVLLAIASKNEPAVADEALARPDVILSRDSVFPVEVHWRPKSESVGRILRAWNVGAESVIFIDDSPMELAEVQAAFPEMECLLFPRGDETAAYELLVRLRDLCGKRSVSADDALRLESLKRAGGAGAVGVGTGDADRFLGQAQAELAMSFDRFPADPRALELINKTNQFNLNGRRYTEGSWLAALKEPGAFLLRAAYKDKYGPLGKVAVMAGRVEGPTVRVDAWVMSCRAFSRRIEHRCLVWVFEAFGACEVIFAYEPTPRNGPLRDFLASFADPQPGFRLSKALFLEKCPPLNHRVENLIDA